MRQYICAFLLCIPLVSPLFTQTLPTERMTIRAARVSGSITIDGILSEAAWERPGYTGIVQAEPDEGAPPTERSEIWFDYDDGAIYFAARFFDRNPDSIMARLVRRDFIWGDPSDGCVLYLDSYHDHKNASFFYVSAAGAVADGIIENDMKRPNDLTWDAVWEGAAHIDEQGWTIEMRIPLSQLRFEEGGSQVWGVDVERYISRRNETQMLAYTPRNESRFVSRFPDLVGIEGVAPSTRLEILPYVTARAERIGNDHQDPFNHRERYLPGGGLDIKAGLSSSLTLDGTVNPDFCQVEVDPANLNLTDIETLYEEKRPFFTEGVGIFRFGRGGTTSMASFNWTNPNIFYSRRIGRTPQRHIPPSDGTSGYYADIPVVSRILGAGKISGRLGSDWKVGALFVLTNREHATIQEKGVRSEIDIEPMTTYGVLRAQRDFNGGMQGLGVLSTYTGRTFNDDALRGWINKNATVLAADAFTFLDEQKTYVITGWGAVSSVSGNQARMLALQRSSAHYLQRPDASHLGVDSAATSMSGAAGRVMLNKNRGDWVFNTAVGFISPRFELNDLGSFTYGDVINAHFIASYRWNKPTAYYQYANVSAGVFGSCDFGWNKTAEGYYLGGSITLPSYYGANLSLAYCPSSFNNRLTRGGPLTLDPASRQVELVAYTDNRQWCFVTAGATIDDGDAMISQTLFATIEFKLSTTLTMSIGPTYVREVNQAQYLTSFTDASAEKTFGRHYVFGRLERQTLATDIRADWIISPRLSFQVYVQPYITAGHYADFKALDRPRSFSFNRFPYDGNPDFNYISLQGNAVLRWEWLPGSTMYLVWTQSRLDDQYVGDFQVRNSWDRMLRVTPDNIFMLKLSYWLGV